MRTRDRGAGALWFIAGALIAVLAMRLGPTRDTHAVAPIVIRTESPTTATTVPVGGLIIGPGLGP